MKKRNERPKRASVTQRRGRVPEDACPTCGAIMRDGKGTFRLKVNGEPVAVAGVPHLKCSSCGEGVLRPEDDAELTRRTHAAYRHGHGLLGIDEIKAIRKKLHLRPAGLGRLLGVDPRLVVRWEADFNVQTQTVDSLLRLLRDVPGNVEYLRRRARRVA